MKYPAKKYWRETTTIKTTLVELMDTATAKAYENEFMWIKNTMTYIHTVQVWGKRMLIRAPQDMHFNIDNEAEEIWSCISGKHAYATIYSHPVQMWKIGQATRNTQKL